MAFSYHSSSASPSQIALPSLSFQPLPTIKFCNHFVLITIRIAGGVRTPSSSPCAPPCKFTPLFSTASRMLFPQPLFSQDFASLPAGVRTPTPSLASFTPSSRRLFSYTYELPSLQPLCFDDLATVGGCVPLPAQQQKQRAQIGTTLRRRGGKNEKRAGTRGATLRVAPVVSSPNFGVRASYNLMKESAVAQSEIIFSVQEAPEGGYEARALGYSIFTQADTLDELKTMVRDAVACHFANGDKPSVIRLQMVKDEVIPA